MGYESLSTVVVLVILMVIAVGWLPRRTVNSMKKVAEHRQDRYSSSLHLVDADSGTRFSDEHTPQPKGAIMQRAQTSTTTRPRRKWRIFASFGVRRSVVGAYWRYRCC